MRLSFLKITFSFNLIVKLPVIVFIFASFIKMKTYFTALLIFLFGFSLSFSQTRYKDDIFSDIRSRTLVYADTLKLDFYDVKKDREQLKPLVILVHGGGFVAGQRNGGDEKGLSKALAKKGYAVASIDYRLSLRKKSFGCDCRTSLKMKTYLETVADLNKSIWYLTNYSKSFNIDPNNVILIGSSAGAEMVLNAVIMRNHYLFKTIYYSDAKIKGIVSFAGATLNNDYLTKENAVPMLFFHGKLDTRVPYALAAHHDCEVRSDGYVLLDGPKIITQKLKDLNQSFSLYVDLDGGHNWAQWGYNYEDIITKFLYENVLNGAKIQTIETIATPISKK